MDLVVLLIETVRAGSPFPILMDLSWIMPKRWGPGCNLPLIILSTCKKENKPSISYQQNKSFCQKFTI